MLLKAYFMGRVHCFYLHVRLSWDTKIVKGIMSPKKWLDNKMQTDTSVIDPVDESNITE